MRNFNKKFIVLVFTALIIFSILPKLASATVLVWDADVSFNTADIAFNTTSQLGETVYQWGFGLAVEVLKRQLLNMIVDQIVNWIQGGGDPKFITDWPGFFRDAIDQAGGKFIQQIGLSQLCSPFKPLLGAGFIPIPTFTTRTSCTLSQIGVNIDVFLKDFKQGNWVAWQEMVLRPQNNIYGAYVLAWDQYEIEKSAASKAAAAEAQAGKGFLSVRKCLESVTDPGDGSVTCTKSILVTPGSVVGDLAAKAVGSDIDYIVNSNDTKAYVSAITNAILNRIFAEGVGLLRTAISGNAGDSGGGGSTAQAQCAQLLGTEGYNDCVTAMQSGIDMIEFRKNYMISLIDRDLASQNQLLGAKQATSIVLNQSIDILKKLNDCDGTAATTLGQVQSAASTTVGQIAQIQSDIIVLQIKQQEIKAITELKQISSFWTQVSGTVKPSLTGSLALSAQQETNQKQQDMNLYKQQLDLCIQLKQLLIGI